MVLKSSLSGHKRHVFKLSAAVVLVVKTQTLTAVAIRCSVTQNDDGVGVLREGGAKEVRFL